MEREQFKIIVKGLKAVYADPKFIPDQDAFNVWFSLLGDLEYDILSVACQTYMMQEEFPPTIAGLRKKVTQITAPLPEDMSEMEAWSVVRKAICNSGYNSVEEFEKLPELCKKAVGSAANLREMSMMDSSEVETVEQSHFIRNYRTQHERKRHDLQIAPDVMALIQKMRTDNTALIASESPVELSKPDGGINTQVERKTMLGETRAKLDELFKKFGKEGGFGNDENGK